MSDTPMTDEAVLEVQTLDYSDKGSVVHKEFAESLERSLRKEANFATFGKALLQQAFFVTQNMPAKAIPGIPGMEPVLARFIIEEAVRRGLELPRWDGTKWV